MATVLETVVSQILYVWGNRNTQTGPTLFQQQPCKNQPVNTNSLEQAGKHHNGFRSKGQTRESDFGQWTIHVCIFSERMSEWWHLYHAHLSILEVKKNDWGSHLTCISSIQILITIITIGLTMAAGTKYNTTENSLMCRAEDEWIEWQNGVNSVSDQGGKNLSTQNFMTTMPSDVTLLNCVSFLWWRCHLDGTTKRPCGFNICIAVRDLLYQGHLMIWINACKNVCKISDNRLKTLCCSDLFRLIRSYRIHPQVTCTDKQGPCRYMECYPLGHQGR